MDPILCPICNSGAMGFELMEKVKNNEATIHDLAIYYNMELADVADHYATHSPEVALMQFTSKKLELINHPDKLLDKLYDMIAYMEEVTDHFKNDPDLKYERSQIETVLKIFQRLESVIMKSAELQGFVKTPQPVTNIAVIESSVGEKVNEVLDIIRDADICADCKIKLLDELDVKGFL